MNNAKLWLPHWTKLLYLVQGIILLAAGVKDLITYSAICNAGLQCTRIINITWLVIGFASLHLICSIFVFFYSCTTTIYQPVICFILWSICIISLVIHHVKQLWAFEQLLSTSLAITLALITTYMLLVLAEALLHVKLICLQQRDQSYTVEKTITGGNDYLFLLLTE